MSLRRVDVQVFLGICTAWLVSGYEAEEFVDEARSTSPPSQPPGQAWGVGRPRGEGRQNEPP